MKSEYDIFISHADADNKSSNDQKGWIDNLAYFFKIFLRALLDHEPKILISKDLENGKAGKSDLSTIFSQTAIFISVISSESINTDKCKNELDVFSKANNDAFSEEIERRGQRD